MSSRLQDGLKLQEKTQKMLQGLPQIVTDYYYVLAASREPYTCCQYIQEVSRFYKFLSDEPQNYDITQIDETDIARYMQYIITKKNGTGELSFAGRKRIWSILNSFFSYLRKKRLIPENLMDYIDRPQQSDNIKRILLTEEDINKLMKTISIAPANDNRHGYLRWTRDICMFTLLVHTGMRVTALTQIDCSDIDLKKRELTIIDKRHKTLQYALNDTEYNAIFWWFGYRKGYLEELGVETDAMFITSRGERITKTGVAKLVREYSKKALGYEITPHKLRAAFCSILYDKTGDIEFVREAVGHANSQVTQRYIVKKESAQKQASELLQNIFTS